MDATLQPVACPSEHSPARPIWYGVDGAWSRGASLRIPRVASWRPGVHPPTASAFAWRLGFCDSPSRGSDTRVTNRGRRLHLRPGTWFTSCQAIGQGAWCRPQESLPPGGGVGERAEPAVEPEGGELRPRFAGAPLWEKGFLSLRGGVVLGKQPGRCNLDSSPRSTQWTDLQGLTDWG